MTHARKLRAALTVVTAALLLSGCGLVNVTTNTNTGGANTPQADHVRSAAAARTPTATKVATTASRTPSTQATSAPASAQSSYGVGVGPVPANQLFTARWFAADSPWNTQVTDLPTDARSNALMHAAMMRVGVIEQPGNLPPKLDRVFINKGLYINTAGYSDPVVQGGVPTKLHCRQVDCGVGNKITELPVPQDVNPDPRYDGWFTIISADGKTAYDLWRARRLPGGTISYLYMRAWNLAGRGYGSAGQVSARGSGLPLFAGLIRPQELQNGQINHTLAISIPAPAARFYVPPASTTDGNGTTDSLPEGARIRLKANIILPKNLHMSVQQRRYANALLWTLRTYGAIVVGRAAVPTLYGQEGVTSSMLVGNELQSIRLSDFEVVQMPEELQYPSPYTQQTGPGAAQ